MPTPKLNNSTPKKGSPIFMIVFDTLFWTLIYLSFLKSEGAENVLTFLVAFLFAMSLFAAATFSRVKKEYAPRRKFRKWYAAITATVETAAFAWMGWFWIASFYAFSSVVLAAYRDAATIEAQKEEKE